MFRTVTAIIILSQATAAHGSIVTADVAVRSLSGQYATLEAGELVQSNWPRYYWNDIPTFAENGGFEFWQAEATGFPSVADGIMTFEVLTDGPVLLAVTTRWGGGGNSSGGWKPELTTQAEFEAQGWEVFVTGLTITRDSTFPDPVNEYVVYRRDSVAGEIFTYRTEKYRAPVVIRSTAVIPEPSAVVGRGRVGFGIDQAVAVVDRPPSLIAESQNHFFSND